MTTDQAIRAEAKDGLDRAAADGLSRLLGSKTVAAVLAPWVVDGAPPAHFLVSRPESVPGLALFHPRFAGNIAQAASRLTRLGPLPHPVALVVRPCEAAGLVELAKIKQVDLGSFLVILADCAGCIPTRDDPTVSSKVRPARGEVPLQAFGAPPPVAADIQKAFSSGSLIETLRPACRICVRMGETRPADILLGAWGQQGSLLWIPVSEKGREALEKGFGTAAKLDPAMATRKKTLDAILGLQKEIRAAETKRFADENGGFEKLQKLLEKCIACRNCSEACPICYCKECKFKLGPLETEGTSVLLAAMDLGIARVPLSPLQYQLGRMVHMAESCVGCGACSDVCPHDVPVSDLFALAADTVQELFGYAAGRDPEAPRPLSSFAEKEFEELGR